MTIPTLLFAVFFANAEAWEDAINIKAGKRIDHRVAWTYRAMVATYALLLINVLFGYSCPQLALAVPACAFGFSAVFRLALNLRRGLDWRYVSPSNWYDWVFICISCGAAFNYRKVWDEHHGFDYNHAPQYKREIHHAGVLAYAWELVVCGACVYLSSVL